jgi:hypothetical protein
MDLRTTHLLQVQYHFTSFSVLGRKLDSSGALKHTYHGRDIDIRAEPSRRRKGSCIERLAGSTETAQPSRGHRRLAMTPVDGRIPWLRTPGTWPPAGSFDD